MEFQLAKNDDDFSSIFLHGSNNLSILEKRITSMHVEGHSSKYGILIREIKNITPEIHRLRMDCLRLCLSKTLQNQSGNLFKTLDQLNQLVRLLHYFDNEKSGLNFTSTSTNRNTFSSLLKVISKVKWQMYKVIQNPIIKH